MELFSRQIKFLNQVETDLFPVLQDTINANNAVIEDYVTDDQLFDRGVDGKNKKLRGYARTTIRIKSKKGQPTDRTTLRDTKKFHNSIVATGNVSSLEMSSNVPYDIYLTKATNYGENILKPSVQNMTLFFEEYYIPDLKKQVTEQIK